MVTPFTIINVLLITTLITACADIDEHTGHLAQEHDVELTEMESELRRRRLTPLRGQVNRSNQRRGQPAPPRPTPPRLEPEVEEAPEPEVEEAPEPEVEEAPEPEIEEAPEPEIEEAPEPEVEEAPEPDAEEAPEDPLSYESHQIQDVLNLPASPYNYAPQNVPAAFAREAALVDNTPPDNLLDDRRATLGRVLFYDTLLSANEEVSCASCHRQEIGFTDDAQFSEGFEGGLTGRNSMSLINSRYYANGAMFWDERALTLEHQVLMPIQDAVEMGVSLEELVSRVEDSAYYPALFTLTFGDPAVTSDRISVALANFVRSIVSHNSPYDQGLAQAGGDPQAPFVNFTPEENRGKDLFFRGQNGGANCAVCHLAPAPGAPRGRGAPRPTSIFFVDGVSNNGLTDGRGVDEDLGHGEVSRRVADNGKFKSPSLRQTALTGPFMHDGSLETLRDVIDHYSEGIQAHPNLDPRLRQGPNGPPQRLNLSDADKDALEAFLHTLTDESLSADERFSNPFR